MTHPQLTKPRPKFPQNFDAYRIALQLSHSCSVWIPLFAVYGNSTARTYVSSAAMIAVRELPGQTVRPSGTGL